MKKIQLDSLQSFVFHRGMDVQQFETLLFRGESETLDFKVDQYAFSGAEDHEQSELLKDILAFANAWRDSEAYILIGVEEKKGTKSAVCGMTKPHLDDHALQQFVNSKTQRPLTFRYEALEYHGKAVGIIQIAVQERPIYLLKNFGKLKANEVWIRRGSSSDYADPDEVARMGRSTIVSQQPKLCIEATPKVENRADGVAFYLHTRLLNKGSFTANEIIVDFMDSTPDAPYTSSDWETRISPFNTPAKGQRRIALKGPLHPEDYRPIAIWKMGAAGFDALTACALQTGSPFDPNIHQATFPGESFEIALRILAKDQKPVIMKVCLSKDEINSGATKHVQGTASSI